MLAGSRGEAPWGLPRTIAATTRRSRPSSILGPPRLPELTNERVESAPLLRLAETNVDRAAAVPPLCQERVANTGGGCRWHAFQIHNLKTDEPVRILLHRERDEPDVSRPCAVTTRKALGLDVVLTAEPAVRFEAQDLHAPRGFHGIGCGPDGGRGRSGENGGRRKRTGHDRRGAAPDGQQGAEGPEYPAGRGRAGHSLILPRFVSWRE